MFEFELVKKSKKLKLSLTWLDSLIKPCVLKFKLKHNPIQVYYKVHLIIWETLTEYFFHLTLLIEEFS